MKKAQEKIEEMEKAAKSQSEEMSAIYMSDQRAIAELKSKLQSSAEQKVALEKRTETAEHRLSQIQDEYEALAQAAKGGLSNLAPSMIAIIIVGALFVLITDSTKMKPIYYVYVLFEGLLEPSFSSYVLLLAIFLVTVSIFYMAVIIDHIKYTMTMTICTFLIALGHNIAFYDESFLPKMPYVVWWIALMMITVCAPAIFYWYRQNEQ